MNTETNTKESLKCDWNDTKSAIKTRFQKLTDANVEAVKENLDLLSGQLQKVYGYAKEQAEKEFASFKQSLKTKSEEKIAAATECKVESKPQQPTNEIGHQESKPAPVLKTA
jgi:uncharacterized protein YjbJ (UPF0337 family)